MKLQTKNINKLNTLDSLKNELENFDDVRFKKNSYQFSFFRWKQKQK